MFKNYFKIAFRNLVRHKLFTGLNIFGLAIGMASSILIFLWVQDELSYDKFNVHANNIYRLTTRLSDINAAVVPIPMAVTMKAEIPVIKNATRLSTLHSIVTIGNTKYDEKNIFYADTNFLQMFSYPLLEGNKATVLSRADGVVLTAKTAAKYFGNTQNAMGKVLHIDNDIKGKDLVVTGVLKDIPHNSHLQFDLLLPISLYDKIINQTQAWGNFDVFTYFQLDDHFDATPAALKSLEQQINVVHDKFDVTKTKSVYFLQPLTAIHLDGQLMLDVEGQGNGQYVRVFSLVAIFILLIACINFMNLSTALSSQRAKEVGMRKAAGAMRSQLIMQFINESLFLSFISMVIGIVVAFMLLPLFNDLAAKTIVFDLFNVKLMAILIGTAVLVGLIAGSYPALYLSSFSAVKVLKGVKNLHGGKTFFRNGLVVMQFAISVILMVSTLVVYQQLQFIRHRDIGFNKDNLLYMQLPQVGDLQHNNQAIKASLSQYPDVADYTTVSHLPTYLTTGTTNVNWSGKDPQQQIIFPQIWVDENFVKTFGMHMLAGRFFSKEFKGDENNFVVNETALKIMKMNPATAVGQAVEHNGQTGQIIGVIKDFNFKPVQKSIEPLILKNAVSGNMNGNAGYMVIRTTGGNLEHTISELKKVSQQVYPDYPFSYGFINDDLTKLYKAEQQMGRLFNVFSVLSILVSCLGLFGLATFTTQKRIKEIGVRKVLGASEAGIVALLSKDFVKLVLLALVIAFPIAWLVMNKWLEGFAYRISISWWIFIFAGVIAILIAFLTVSYQSVKAAFANPVKSLRSE
ncbi:ABC transporter permease [Chitinophaga sp. MM2321]|uniref:ABC transporter permease n=1 Tax=Chitinophaga sp. MM2321 TaxID=3137178 RepID=UPI0032D5916C